MHLSVRDVLLCALGTDIPKTRGVKQRLLGQKYSNIATDMVGVTDWRRGDLQALCKSYSANADTAILTDGYRLVGFICDIFHSYS